MIQSNNDPHAIPLTFKSVSWCLQTLTARPGALFLNTEADRRLRGRTLKRKQTFCVQALSFHSWVVGWMDGIAALFPGQGHTQTLESDYRVSGHLMYPFVDICTACIFVAEFCVWVGACPSKRALGRPRAIWQACLHEIGAWLAVQLSPL